MPHYLPHLQAHLRAGIRDPTGGWMSSRHVHPAMRYGSSQQMLAFAELETDIFLYTSRAGFWRQSVLPESNEGFCSGASSPAMYHSHHLTMRSSFCCPDASKHFGSCCQCWPLLRRQATLLQHYGLLSRDTMVSTDVRDADGAEAAARL